MARFTNEGGLVKLKIVEILRDFVAIFDDIF